MFKVMLYTRVVLTVLVVVLIVRVIYRRVAAMLKSRGNTDVTSLNDLRDQSDSAESDMLNMTVQNDGQQNDTERSDSFDDTSVGNNTSSDDDTIVEMSIVETEEGTILDRVVVHTDAQTGESIIEEEIIVIAPEDTVPVDEVLAEEAAADAAIATDV